MTHAEEPGDVRGRVEGCWHHRVIALLTARARSGIARPPRGVARSRNAPPASGSLEGPRGACRPTLPVAVRARGAPARRASRRAASRLVIRSRSPRSTRRGTARRRARGRGTARRRAALALAARADPSGCCNTTTSAPARTQRSMHASHQHLEPTRFADRQPAPGERRGRVAHGLALDGPPRRPGVLRRDPRAGRATRRTRDRRCRRTAGRRSPGTRSSALAVVGPKMPSMRPGSNPSIPSRRCSSATSSPRCIGRRR